jgi:hypothetical protein
MLGLSRAYTDCVLMPCNVAEHVKSQTMNPMTTPPPKRNSTQTWRAPSKQSPAQINVSRIFAEPQQFAPSTSATSVLESKLPPPPELLERTEETRRQKRERDPSPLNQAVMTNDATAHQSASTSGASPLEQRYSNKRVKRSANTPKSTEDTILRKNSGGWFGQRGRQRPATPQSMLEGVESNKASTQSTSAVQIQPSEISQPTTAPTTASQTPALLPDSNATPIASGSQLKPVAIPLDGTTNPNTIPSGSPARGRWLGSLRRANPQPAKAQEPQPSGILEGVSESTRMDLDPPTALPLARDPSPARSKPPSRTGWFSKSVTSSPTPIQQSPPDVPTPSPPTPSLRVIEATTTSSSAEHVPAEITVNTAAGRYVFNIPLLGRSKMKAQGVVDLEDLGTPLCSVSIYSTNVNSIH